MLKKLLKVGITFTLLLGCYLGYVRAFNLVVQQFQADRPTDITIFPNHDSRSKQHAQDLARLAFGADHWTVTSDQPYAYYNASAASGCTPSSTRRSRKRTACATTASG